MKTKKILRCFTEPYQLHEEVWVMKPKKEPFVTIINPTCMGCLIEAKNQIKIKNHAGNKHDSKIESVSN
jgi:succinyl-CoA synthetase alpha subunit